MFLIGLAPGTAVTCPIADTEQILQLCHAWLIPHVGGRRKFFLDSGSVICLIKRGLAKDAGLSGLTKKLKMSIAGGGWTAPTD